MTPRVILVEGWAPSLIRIPETGQFRIYYQFRDGANLQMRMLASNDQGATWAAPVVVRTQIEANGASWGASVVDRGAGVSDLNKRFKNIHYWIGPGSNGPYVDNSANGLTWEAPSSRSTPVVSSSDQLDAFSLGSGFGLFTKTENATDYPRETWVSFGDGNFRNWSTPVKAFWRDLADPVDLEFYGATPLIVRGDWLITFVRILRDKIERGKGYSVMAWAHKDRPTAWTRSRKPFFEGVIATADQAHAWLRGVVEYNGTVYFTYDARPDGHKEGPRYVGFTAMPSSELAIRE